MNISWRRKNVVICSAYFPSDSVEMPPLTEFKRLAEYGSEKKRRSLVGIDANG